MRAARARTADDPPAPTTSESLALGMFIDALLRSPAPPPEAPSEAGAGAAAQEGDTEAPAADARPAWADHPFATVQFEIAHLRLALPMAGLHAIIDWPDSLGRPPDLRPHELGVTRFRDRSAVLIDAARLLDPGRDRAMEACGYQRVLMIAGGSLGLATSSDVATVTMHPDEVRWRAAARRPWMLGTDGASMSTLLDPEALAAWAGHGGADPA